MFQSHNGAIAAPNEAEMRTWWGKFQSHNGAIAARLPVRRFNQGVGFNPTMVRLLQLPDFNGVD